MEEKPASVEETIETPAIEQSPTKPPTPSFQEKLKANKFRILAGVLGILVFAGAVFGAYKLGQRQAQPAAQPTPTPEVVATPTPDLTADWKTYTNTKYGYSIKYPQGVIVEDDKEQNLVIFEFPKEEDWIAGFSVWYYSNLENLDPQSFYQKLYDEEKAASEEGLPPPPEPLESKGVNVGNLRGFQVRILAYEAYERITYLGKDDKMVAIRFADENPNDPLQKEHLDTFNLMLSTFRFLEEYIQSPNPKECTVDDDCQLERFEAGACCSLICGEFWKGTVINKQEIDRREEWRTRNCQRPTCPLAECKPPDYTFEVKCENKTCVAIKKVIKESD